MIERDPADRRRRLDSVIPEIIKRAVEIGVEKAAEAPDSLKELVGGMKIPRDAVHYVLTQIEETKNGLLRVVAKEVRGFLEQTNVSAEMQKILTTVQFEISTTIRFRPADEGASAPAVPRPDVRTDVQFRRVPRSPHRVDAQGEGPSGEERPRERRRNRE